ncbi:MAG: histone deacetylase family protein, partial [Proteobacteria bacterium]|nr:histone deacetylase family protein [Pseudomonadota bacterium]
MQIIHSPKHVAHEGGMELHRGALVPCFEMPARADYILRAVKAAGFSLSEPQSFSLETLFRVHDGAFVEFLRTAHDAWRAEGREGFMLPGVFPARGMRRDRIPESLHGRMGYYTFDASTPIVKGTWEAALAAAECALTAAAQLVEGRRSSYALCRPPGHHAGRAMYGGYCFLNNAALAAQYLRDNGFGKVAVLDVDYHHGNGTQEFFEERKFVFTSSIHGDPNVEYPYYWGYAEETGVGQGEGTNLNLPLPLGSGGEAYLGAVDQFLEAME